MRQAVILLRERSNAQKRWSLPLYFRFHMHSEKILIVIPAYNEADNIQTVLEGLRQENPQWNLVVINDGSVDNTGEIAERTGLAETIHLPCNLGIGGTVQTGLKYAQRHEYDIAVQFDGDGQHNADEINKLIVPILTEETDVVIGSRFLKKHNGFKSDPVRRLGIGIFRVVNSVLINQPITDNTSGFRAYNRKAIKFLSNYYPIDYPEPEAIILLAKNGFRMKEVYVEMNDRVAGRSSIRGCRTVYYMIKVLLAIIINMVRPRINHD